MKATKNIMAFNKLFMQMHTLVFNKINKDNSIDMQNEGSAEIYCMELDYQPNRTLNDAFLKWKDAITETENVMSSKEIGKLKIALHTRFCKSIITDAKENCYITDNDLVRFIEHFKIVVAMIKDYKNPKKQFKQSEYFISDCNFHFTKSKHIFKYCEYFMIIEYF